jgi:hypothetical protein
LPIGKVIISHYAIAYRLFVFGIVSAHLRAGANLSFHRIAGPSEKAGGEWKLATNAFAVLRLFLRSAVYSSSLESLFWSLRGAEASLVAPRLAERLFDLVGRLVGMRHSDFRL